MFAIIGQSFVFYGNAETDRNYFVICQKENKSGKMKQDSSFRKTINKRINALALVPKTH